MRTGVGASFLLHAAMLALLFHSGGLAGSPGTNQDAVAVDIALIEIAPTMTESPGESIDQPVAQADEPSADDDPPPEPVVTARPIKRFDPPMPPDTLRELPDIPPPIRVASTSPIPAQPTAPTPPVTQIGAALPVESVPLGPTAIPTIESPVSAPVQADDQPRVATLAVATPPEPTPAPPPASSQAPALDLSSPSETIPLPRPTAQMIASAGKRVRRPPATPADQIASLIEAAQAEQAGSAPDTRSSIQDRFALGGEGGQLRRAIAPCWSTTALSTEAAATTVLVRFSLAIDGRPEGDIVLEAHEGGNAVAANIAYQAARRAIRNCLRNGIELPRETYANWQSVVIAFNPDSMSGR